MSMPRPAALGLGVAGTVFMLDQLMKAGMLYGLRLDTAERITLTPFLDLVLTWNKGVSYGLFQQNSAYGPLVLAGFNLAVAALLLRWLWQQQDKCLGVALGLMIGGALGNAVDRLLYGAVVDFFSLHFRDFYWYVFNGADMAIVGGVVLMLADNVLHKKREA